MREFLVDGISKSTMAASSARASKPVDILHRIPERDWELYRSVIEKMQARSLRFAIGGGWAYSVYAQRWRNTKDIDLFMLPDDREAAIEALSDAGFRDYHERLPYDRGWIFRGYREDVIVDIIWQMANYRTKVDEAWLSEGWEIAVGDKTLRLLPIEELIWSKLYVVQRDRCDWPDLLSILYAQGPTLNWERLLNRIGDDVPLFAGLVSMFAWMCPARARDFPAWLWPRLGISEPASNLDCKDDPRHVRLLDGRNWFGPSDDGG